MSSSSSGSGYTRATHDVEGQNDERLEGLLGKVKLLKDVGFGSGRLIPGDGGVASSLMCQGDWTDDDQCMIDGKG